MTDLCDAILMLKNRDEVSNFLKDLCTPGEVSSFEERWKVCQLLHRKDHSYRDIHALTGASLVTIGRVARFLNTENYKGYKTILERIEDTPPSSKPNEARIRIS